MHTVVAQSRLLSGSVNVLSRDNVIYTVYCFICQLSTFTWKTCQKSRWYNGGKCRAPWEAALQRASFSVGCQAGVPSFLATAGKRPSVAGSRVFPWAGGFSWASGSPDLLCWAACRGQGAGDGWMEALESPRCFVTPQQQCHHSSCLSWAERNALVPPVHPSRFYHSSSSMREEY